MPRTHRRKKRAAASTIRRRRVSDRRRAELVASLGGECRQCGRTNDLTVDHIHGTTWDVSKVHYSKRLRIYGEEAAAGLLQLLCVYCNAAKGRPAGDDEPF